MAPTMDTGTPHSATRAPAPNRGARATRVVLAAIVTLLAVGIPTDIVANPWFGREIPVRWWEYPVLAATVILTAAWFAIEPAAASERRSGTPTVGVVLAVFAVGCPVCNKLVLATIGVSGALGWWAPLQPILAALSLTMLVAAVVYRWRRRPCGDSCEQPRGPAAGLRPTR